MLSAGCYIHIKNICSSIVANVILDGHTSRVCYYDSILNGERTLSLLSRYINYINYVIMDTRVRAAA